MKNPTKLQTLYCEKYGIIESTLNKNLMTYYTSHPSNKKEDCITYKVTVNLEKFKEIERSPLKRYYKKGEVNMYL